MSWLGCGFCHGIFWLVLIVVEKGKELFFAMKSERIAWIESLRAIALLMVVVTHFIAAFCPEAFGVWQTHSLF